MIDKVRCINPFYTMEINLDSQMTPCCEYWCNVRLGRFMDGTVEEAWNNSHYQALRKAMRPGEDPTYFCREHICPYYQSGKWYDLEENALNLPPELVEEIRNGKTGLSTGPLLVKVGSDYRCNYNCIMCDGKNFIKSQRVESVKVMERLGPYLPKLPHLILLSSGELFANKDLLDFLGNLDREIHRGLNIYIMTNASMITEKRWQKLKGLNVKSVMVSIDAATRESYEAIRINGKWDNLQERLKFLQSLRLSNTVPQWSVNMTVMRKNSSEVAAFAYMAQDLKTDLVLFTWINSYTPELIHENFDWLTLKKIVDQLQDPIFHEEWVLGGDLKGWRSYYDEYQSNLAGRALPGETVERVRFRVCSQIMERQYESLLGDKPTRNLLEVWLDRLHRLDELSIDGRLMAYEWLRRLFLSAEYQSKKSRDKEFVESLYRIILQRNPLDHEISYWAQEAQNRLRPNILFEFLRSDEFWERSALAFRSGITDRKMNLVASMFLAIHPEFRDLPELVPYLQKLQNGSDLRKIIHELMMREFAATGNIQNPEQIQSLFKIMFLRFPTAAEEKAYLQTSMTPDYLIQRLMSTREFQSRLEYAVSESASPYPQDDSPVKFS
ncbi:DUF4214 domain-containing protein [Candidatus Sumerlaeota bacterium]|nr:DUF4214 domain-containing protein [Candidatus Sumerlaeota bacterium]